MPCLYYIPVLVAKVRPILPSPCNLEQRTLSWKLFLPKHALPDSQRTHRFYASAPLSRNPEPRYHCMYYLHPKEAMSPTCHQLYFSLPSSFSKYLRSNASQLRHPPLRRISSHRQAQTTNHAVPQPHVNHKAWPRTRRRPVTPLDSASSPPCNVTAPRPIAPCGEYLLYFQV